MAPLRFENEQLVQARVSKSIRRKETEKSRAVSSVETLLVEATPLQRRAFDLLNVDPNPGF